MQNCPHPRLLTLQDNDFAHKKAQYKTGPLVFGSGGVICAEPTGTQRIRLGSDQSNVLISLEFFGKQTGILAEQRAPAWELPTKPLFLPAKNPINLQEAP